MPAVRLTTLHRDMRILFALMTFAKFTCIQMRSAFLLSYKQWEFTDSTFIRYSLTWDLWIMRLCYTGSLSCYMYTVRDAVKTTG